MIWRNRRCVFAVCVAVWANAGSMGLGDNVKDATLREYECRRAKGEIKIDGELGDAAWQEAEIISRFYELETLNIARSRTDARLLWDEENLYAAIRAYDRDICTYGKERDTTLVFQGDVLELFIQTSEIQPYYCEIDITPGNLIYDAYYGYGNEGHTRFSKWNASVESATAIKGSLDEWMDEDEMWQLEFRIPFSTLPSLEGKVPQPGTTWRFHVARCDHSVYLKGLENSSCAPLAASFHQLNRFCYLQFTGD